MPSLDIILVNWNAGHLVRECLASVEESDLTGIVLQRIVIVDNASTDDSLAGLAESPLPVNIIRNQQNLGFGRACNIGVQDSQSEFILLLNPDTRIQQNTLKEALQFMAEPANQKIGILGVQLLDDAEQITCSCRYFPTPLRILSRIVGINTIAQQPALNTVMPLSDHQKSHPVDQVMGAFFLTRRELYQDLGGMDERFFMYYEEVDYARRAHDMGYISYYLATTQAYHHGWGTSAQVKALRLAYNLQSRIQYGYKHFQWLTATLLLCATLFIEPVTRTVLTLISQPRSLGQIWLAYILLWQRLLLKS